ncbi:MAG: ribonuclease III [Eubacteriales bacterium]|nr:ribonuclease III [Eubacteriales bacterium]
MHNKNLDEFMSAIGYKFKNINLLKNALTHSSYANEKNGGLVKDNERLEFLGDAVLELVSSDFIYNNNPSMDEGKMTRLRASIVCEPTLALCARKFHLDDFIMLGKGEELTGGRSRDSIVSDACEALIGAIYLDGGFANAKEFVNKFILNDLENKKLFFDSKTILQEFIQGIHKEVTYEIIGEEGPEHNKQFIASAYVADLFNVTSKGHTKKAAEQHAAYEALVFLRDNGYKIETD